MALTKAGEIQRLRGEIAKIDADIEALNKVRAEAKKIFESPDASDDDVDKYQRQWSKASSKIRQLGRDRDDVMERLQRVDR